MKRIVGIGLLVFLLIGVFGTVLIGCNDEPYPGDDVYEEELNG